METITREDVKNLIDSRGDYVLIDVREKEELVYGMLPTAKHIPLHELDDALSLSDDTFLETYRFVKPKKDVLIIFYCRTGGRSAKATELARAKGFLQAKNYAGSVYDWAEIDVLVRRY